MAMVSPARWRRIIWHHLTWCHLTRRHVMTAMLVLLGAASLPARTASHAAAPAAANIRGIHTLAASRPAIDDQLAWARALVGAGGFVTQPFLGIGPDTAAPSADAVYFVEQAYARDLTPILVLQGRYLNRDGCNVDGYVGWLAPTPDADGLGFGAEAAGYARFVAGLPRTTGRPLYVQVGNEPNLHEMWGGAASPAAYARFLVAVSDAIRALGEPRIQILNAALAPEGDLDNLRFVADALAAEPRFGGAFDGWASHPYPRNRPPASNLRDGTAPPGSRYAIDAYLLELAALRAGGVDTAGLGVFLTETGYELGDRHHGEFPPVTEELRAAYIREALTIFWPRWPEVRAVTPFQLSGWYGGWRTFEWVHPTSETTRHGLPTQPRRQYAALVPAVGAAAGRVVDDQGAPLANAELAAEPGGYRATSLSDGSFLLLAPPGAYTLTARRDGYQEASRPAVVGPVAESDGLLLALAFDPMSRPRNVDFERGLDGWTRWGDLDGVQDGPWYFGVAAHAGERFLGTAVHCGAKDGGAYQTVAASPGQPITAAAWTLTVREGSIAIGNRIGIDPTGGSDPAATGVVWSSWIETGGDWLSVAVTVTAERDRVTVFLEHDQDAANPWNVSAFDAVAITIGP